MPPLPALTQLCIALFYIDEHHQRPCHAELARSAVNEMPHLSSRPVNMSTKTAEGFDTLPIFGNDQTLCTDLNSEKKAHEPDAALPILDRSEEERVNTISHTFPVISTYKAIVLVGLVMISSMMQVASGIGVSITIADIGHELKIPSGQLQWVASAGSLATACTLLVSGKLADMYGHKPVFVIGCTLGGAMFLGMGLARDKYQLFVFRALGGVAFSG
jgi:hypothetical protein